MTDVVLAGLAVSGVAAAVITLAHYSRQGRVPAWSLIPLAVLCAAGLIAMTLSDWPSEQLATFWAGHSVLSATLSTLLLVGAGYLAFEARENYEQQTMTSSLAAGAFGGCVDHVLDIDVALSLVRRTSAPPGAGEGKPLRWLRAHRDQLVEHDPRRDEGGAIAPAPDDAWRARVVDECVRRLMAGLRDWSPLLSQTRDGVAVLARLAGLRNRLLELADDLTRGGDLRRCAELLGEVQHECRLLALGLELGSGVPLGHHRPGVLPPEVLHLHAPGAPRSFQRLLAQADKLSTWHRGRDGERALKDFRSAFGSETPAQRPHPAVVQRPPAVGRADATPSPRRP